MMQEESGWCPSVEYQVRGSDWNKPWGWPYLPVKIHEGREEVASGNPGVPLLDWGVPSFLAIE